MPRYIAFLRAVNVGGHFIKMAALRTYFEMFGFTNVETFIASGNVIFESLSYDIPALKLQIEEGLRESLDYEVTTFLRTDTQIANIARYKPFDDAKLATAKALNVLFLAEELSDEAEKILIRLQSEIDDFHVHGQEVYWLCRKKQSESNFSNTKFEKT